MLNRYNLYYAIFFFVISLIFYFYPSLDIDFVRFFYKENEGFVYSQNLCVRFIFRAVPIITMIYGFALLGWTMLLAKRRTDSNKILFHLTLLFSIVIGSGLFVNMGLKDNFGRARPKQINEFGAKKEFSRVYEIADQCSKNCSFASGHAAAAYSLTTIAFLVPANLQLITYHIAILYGTLVGFGRILQGGHFASDVASSAWIVLIVNYLLISLFLFYRKHSKLKQKKSESDAM